MPEEIIHTQQITSPTIINLPAHPTTGENIPGTNLTWTLNANGTLTISGTGDMIHDFCSTPIPWKDKRDLIKKVIIEAGVTSIGDLAFDSCQNLQTVEILGNITKVGKRAFQFCGALKEMKPPDSVTEIDREAFFYCTHLDEFIERHNHWQ